MVGQFDTCFTPWIVRGNLDSVFTNHDQPGVHILEAHFLLRVGNGWYHMQLYPTVTNQLCAWNQEISSTPLVMVGTTQSLSNHYQPTFWQHLNLCWHWFTCRLVMVGNVPTSANPVEELSAYPLALVGTEWQLFGEWRQWLTSPLFVA